VAATVPLALSLSACGGGGSSAPTNDAQGRSPSPSATHSTSSSTGQTTQASGSRISSTAFLKLLRSASRKITTVRVSMSGDTSGQGYSMKGAMDFTGDKPAMQLTMKLPSSSLSGVQMRLVGGTIYMSLGSLTNGKFVKFDLNDPNSPLGSVGSSLDQLDPSKMLSDVGPGAFKRVTYVGTDRSGRHYRTVLVTAKSPQLKGLPASARANLPKTMGYDVWLDAQGRLSKFHITVPQVTSLTATYTDYGADVHIAAPPASQVTQLPTGSPSL
jgi:hypothetical protein